MHYASGTVEVAGRRSRCCVILLELHSYPSLNSIKKGKNILIGKELKKLQETAEVYSLAPSSRYGKLPAARISCSAGLTATPVLQKVTELDEFDAEELRAVAQEYLRLSEDKEDLTTFVTGRQDHVALIMAHASELDEWESHTFERHGFVETWYRRAEKLARARATWCVAIL
jgi:hypothetical protein